MNLERLLQKHRAFWEPASGAEPLLAEFPAKSWQLRPYPLADGTYVVEPREIKPSDMDIDKLLGLDKGLSELTIGDHIQTVTVVHSVSWMETLLGCPIYASAYSCSAKPVVRSVAEGFPAFHLKNAMESPWLTLMERILDREVEVAGTARPADQLHLRGVVDMLAAYLGETSLCISLMDTPEALEKLADTFADLFLEVVKRSLKKRPLWRGGRVSTWGIYAPGPLIDYQVDASSIISPGLYKRHISPYDEKILTEFPYSMTHLHACGLHMIDAVLDTRGISAIQVNLDRETGRWDKERILHTCRKIQDRGNPLLINGELDDQELDEFLHVLKPGGLAIFYSKPVKG